MPLANAPSTVADSLPLHKASPAKYSLPFTGSQHYSGINPATGIYSASVFLPSTNATYASKLLQSSSIKLIPVWGSLDGTVGYLTGTAIYAYPPTRSTSLLEPKKYVVTVTGLKTEFDIDEQTFLKVNIFDKTSIKVVKTPVELPGSVIRDVHYSIRDVNTSVPIIPFDTTNNSTRVSSDASGMYFKLDVGNLIPGRSYVVDVMIVTNDNEQIFRSASASFRVIDLP